MIFLYLLVLDAFFVGMSLGVLLPVVFPGACFGISLIMLIGSFAGLTSSPYYVPVAGGAAALICAILSARYVRKRARTKRSYAGG